MSDMSDPEFRACAVCARVLNRVTYPDREGGWVHGSPLSAPEDHPAVPVLYDEVAVQFVCDFCRGKPVEWVVPARTFKMPMGNSDSIGDWSACTPCARLIRNNRWSALTDRVLAVLAQQKGSLAPGSRALLTDMYNQLQKAINGPLRLYTGPN